MKILRWIGIVVAALVVVIALVFVGARFADGPLALIPGGALRSGELVADPDVDWTFAADVPTIVDWYMEGKINIDDLITHTMPLDDINKAFDLMHAGESIRSVVVY